jgi:CDP-glycerol glycerophosphotransferase (TagB/SpsB family)
MITDTSGTAFTYAFLTKKPVIFISKNEKLLAELGYDKLAYFKDREKVGVIVEEINKIKNTIENISSIEEKIKRSNDLLEKEITYLGNSKSRIYNVIEKIV